MTSDAKVSVVGQSKVMGGRVKPRVIVFSHKLCWPSESSPSGYASDGGFPLQMAALSELFESTTLMVPCARIGNHAGETPLTGHRVIVAPLSNLEGAGLRRKLSLPFWFVRNAPLFVRATLRADAVHTPIPGDIGTIGMVLAFLLRKPLFVRHCGNWLVPRTLAEHFWKWFMESFAGGRIVCLATGGAPEPPSRRNGAIRWIFSTTLRSEELLSFRARQGEAAGDHLRLIIACRQEVEKGAGIVILSLPAILKQFPLATLDVVGDGSALDSFKQMATDLGVRDRVTFHGKVGHARVIELLQRSHIFCYPTAASEGFPKAVVEALACALPVIATRVSVLPQLIGGGCGLLIEEASSAALAEAVREIWMSKTRYRELSANALDTAQQYSLEGWRDTIAGLLKVGWSRTYGDARSV